ncbi:hypothetical protein F4782DRAFT_552889 [Xylaria castorea]|nr:hypothetical protein F4782DRAFT_552889 [Xylaria castorea]
MASYSVPLVCSFTSPSCPIQTPGNSLISHTDTMTSKSPADHLFHAVSHFEPPAKFGIKLQSAPANTADAQYYKFHVMGEGFYFANDLVGPSAIKAFLKDTFVPAYHDNLDTTKDPVSQPPEIISDPEAPDATFAMVLHGECVAKSG